MTHSYYAVLLIANRTTLTINAIGSPLLIVDQSSLIVTPLSLIVANSYKHVFVYIYWSNVTGQSLRLSTCDSSASTLLVYCAGTSHRKLPLISAGFNITFFHSIVWLLASLSSILVFIARLVQILVILHLIQRYWARS